MKFTEIAAHSEQASIAADLLLPRYDLTEGEVSELSRELLSTLPLERLPNDTKFMSTELEPGNPLANIARYIEEKVFVEEFGNDSQEMIREYGPYEGASRFWVVCDLDTQMPIGALRAIEASEAGLKTINDIDRVLNISPDAVREGHCIDFEATWDVGTVAVLPEYRGLEYEFFPSLILYRSLYSRGVDLGVEHFVSIIDASAESNLNLLGMPFKPILGSSSFEYLGSGGSTALYSKVSDLAEGVQARMNEVLDHHDAVSELIYKSCDALHNGAVVDSYRI